MKPSLTSQKALKAQKFLSNRRWRMCEGRLYKIIDKFGKDAFITPNIFQIKLLDELWFLNIILKARQLGFSTWIAIFCLDYALWNTNKSIGIIDQTLDDAKSKLKKIRYAYQNMPETIKAIAPKIVTDNKEELEFSNGSKITVGTSHRGGTLNVLWISEHGPICKKSPEKAREIKTGAFQAIQAGQIVFIESTAAGAEGDFYEMCKVSKLNRDTNQQLTELDYKFHFFSWWEEKGYSLKIPDGFVFPRESLEYFESLYNLGIELTEDQMFWYYKKYLVLQEDMLEEYPSTPEEAFEASNKEKYYFDQVQKLRRKGQVCEYGIDEDLPVHTVWDLGVSDSMSIWFYQLYGQEIRVIDFYENSGEGLSHYGSVLKEKPYKYGDHWAPHDIRVRELSTGKSRLEVAAGMGINFKIVPNIGVDDGINNVRRTLKNCWFLKSNTTKGLDHIEKYKKKWNQTTQVFSGPLHDEHSHAADAFRYLSIVAEPPQKVEYNPALEQELIDHLNSEFSPI